jgi:hypothetical protein
MPKRWTSSSTTAESQDLSASEFKGRLDFDDVQGEVLNGPRCCLWHAKSFPKIIGLFCRPRTDVLPGRCGQVNRDIADILGRSLDDRQISHQIYLKTA